MIFNCNYLVTKDKNGLIDYNEIFPKRRLHPWQLSLPTIFHALLVSYEVKMNICVVGFRLTSVCKLE